MKANKGYTVLFEHFLESKTNPIATSTTFDCCSLYWESSPHIHRGIVPLPGLSIDPGIPMEERNRQYCSISRSMASLLISSWCFKRKGTSSWGKTTGIVLRRHEVIGNLSSAEFVQTQPVIHSMNNTASFFLGPSACVASAAQKSCG